MARILADGRIIDKAIQSAMPSSRRLSNWLDTFINYVSPTECPRAYLPWSGLATIAGAAQRKIYMDMEYFKYDTNMYITLVGPPGIGKTTALRQGKKMLAKVPGINMSPDAPSVAGIMMEFDEIAHTNKEHQSINVFINELSSLYENAKETVSGFLTTIFDCDDNYRKRTRVGGNEAIPRPWLNLHAATTPSWLGENLTPSAIEGGFVARMLFIYSDEERLTNPLPAKLDTKVVEDMTNDLVYISNLRGEFHWTPEGSRAYSAWYRDRSRLPSVPDNRTYSYFRRKPVHLHKVAMALALAEDDRLVLDTSHMDRALQLLAAMEIDLPRALSSVGGNQYATDIERVEAQIAAAGPSGISYRDLVKLNSHAIEKRMLDQVLETLEMMGTVSSKMHINSGIKIYRSS